MIFVRKITTLLVISEISKLKKNRYGHIDRGLLANCNQANSDIQNRTSQEEGLAPAAAWMGRAGASPSS